MDIRVVCRRPTVACAKATVGFLFLVLLGAPAAQAQDIPAPSLEGVDRLLGGVVVLAPDYEGSDDYEVAIGPLANFKFAGDRSVRVLGNRAFLNVLNSKTWEVGPKAVFRGGRDDVDDNRVDLMRDVDNALELGGYVKFNRVINNNIRHRFSFDGGITQDITDEHDGYVFEGGGTYWQPVGKTPFDIGLRGSVSYASSDYMSTFFDVSAADSAASGLSTFSAESGFKDVGVGLMGVLHLSLNWKVGGGLFYKRMLGDAADSPVVDDAGDANQLIGGLSVFYAW